MKMNCASLSLAFLILLTCHDGCNSSSNVTVTKFWLHALPRSGTNLLHSLLSSHSQVLSLHERLRFEIESRVDNMNPRELASEINSLLDKAVHESTSRTIGAVGLKISPNVRYFGASMQRRFNHDENLIKDIVDANVGLARLKFVYLTRRDQVARALSLREANALSHYHYRSEQDVHESVAKHAPIRVNVDSFASSIVATCKQQERIDRWMIELEESGHDVFRVDYEDGLVGVDNILATMHWLFAFLGVGDDDSVGSERALEFIKSPQSSMTLRERVSNWRQLLGALGGARKTLCNGGKPSLCCRDWMRTLRMQ
jgi:LPS sulfotransferase NodH